MKKLKVYNETENMTEEELKQKYLAIDEELKIIDRKIAEIKSKLLSQLNKDGPNEFTKEVFSGTTIQPNRINIHSETQKLLQEEKEQINKLLKEKKRKRIIESFDGDIKDIKLSPGSMGVVLTVKI